MLLLVALGLFWPRGEGTVGTTEPSPVQPPAEGAPHFADVVADARPTAGTNADFDYYVLVLSWSPTYCASDAGRGREDDMQCRSGRPYGFVLHGLWPQHERGYPQNCRIDGERAVPETVMTQALRLTPSRDLVEHEWSKHGACSGLPAADYFAAAASAVASVKIPGTFAAPERPIATTSDDVRQAFLDANRSISSDGLAATCSRNQLAEVWVCLDKTLRPRACSQDVRKRHCGRREVRMRAVRGDWPR